ncbi:peptidoglycan DD-metalloendopeptidase family protein [Curtobacterium sp. RRHDQ66]|uniref:peptidoglycan DD-metalloendopeptidase family protein n=1 Tax=Curtobacterium guangdongense TaxID=3413380 RepID=UPI003BEFA593
MLEATLQPGVSGRTTPDGRTPDGAVPAVHMTRRARIEAERAAAKHGVQHADGTASAAPVDAAPVDAAPVSPSDQAVPVTPPAPSSPVLPASVIEPATPPAPSSPVVAPAASRRVSAQVPAARRRTTAPAPRVDRATRHLGAGRPSAAAAPEPTKRTGASFRKNASRATAVGALLFVAGLVVSTSLPAQALYTPEPGSTTVQAAVDGDTQSLRVGDATEGSTNRDAYTVSDATQYKNVDSSSFTNDPDGTIQWPFLTGVPITSGFGGRQVEGCSFCSTNHQGVDFAPGAGTPIRVIAAGTVIKVQPNDGGFGNDVWVEHDVDGKQFTSVYGHMMDNSFKVVKGQQVAVGDELGLVGSTGNSTGPHLHLEVHVDGVPVDPLAWLQANAN